MHRIRISAKLIAIACLIGLPVTLNAAIAYEIVTWNGNTRDWNQRLGVTLIRMGCNLKPDVCMQRLGDAAESQRVARWAISISHDVTRVEEDALEYSRRSLDEKRLVDVDVDDFVGAMRNWNSVTPGRANQVLANVTRNVKRLNPVLRFGITLYEDELDSPVLAAIPGPTRSQVNRVSLYLHYRSNAKFYRRYVDEVRRTFPHAEIWAGSYAYDRTDYLPCSASESASCTPDEETEFFRESLKIQIQLLREGLLTGIEFYPGFFGREEHWSGWKESRICQPRRLHSCVESTRRMRSMAEYLLQEHH